MNCHKQPEVAYEGRKDTQAINDNIYDRMMAAKSDKEAKHIAKEFNLVMGPGEERINYETKGRKSKREFKYWWED